MVVFHLPYNYRFGITRRMEKLSSFLRREHLTYSQFGAMIGTTGTTVYRYAKGMRIPDAEQMRSIFEITSGEVTPNDFYGLEDGKC